MAGVIWLLYQFFGAPHSFYEVFETNKENISPNQGTSSFEYFTVQGDESAKYYIDDASYLCVKKGNKTDILMENIAEFLVCGDRIIYTLFKEDNEEDKDIVYIDDIHEIKKTVLTVLDKTWCEILFTDEEYIYIYSGDNILYKYNEALEKVEEIRMKEKGYDGCFERACVMNHKIVFATDQTGNANRTVYIYDEEKESLKKVDVIDGEENHSTFTDITRWNGDIYFLLGYYLDPEYPDSHNRVDCDENGIYKLNVEEEKFEKVSGETGLVFMIKKNQLYLVDSYSQLFPYKVKKTKFN